MTFFLSPFVKDTLYQLYCSFDSELVLQEFLSETGKLIYSVMQDQLKNPKLARAELMKIKGSTFDSEAETQKAILYIMKSGGSIFSDQMAEFFSIYTRNNHQKLNEFILKLSEGGDLSEYSILSQKELELNIIFATEILNIFDQDLCLEFIKKCIDHGNVTTELLFSLAIDRTDSHQFEKAEVYYSLLHQYVEKKGLSLIATYALEILRLEKMYNFKAESQIVVHNLKMCLTNDRSLVVQDGFHKSEYILMGFDKLLMISQILPDHDHLNSLKSVILNSDYKDFAKIVDIYTDLFDKKVGITATIASIFRGAINNLDSNIDKQQKDIFVADQVMFHSFPTIVRKYREFSTHNPYQNLLDAINDALKFYLNVQDVEIFDRTILSIANDLTKKYLISTDFIKKLNKLFVDARIIPHDLINNTNSDLAIMAILGHQDLFYQFTSTVEELRTDSETVDNIFWNLVKFIGGLHFNIKEFAQESIATKFISPAVKVKNANRFLEKLVGKACVLGAHFFSKHKAEYPLSSPEKFIKQAAEFGVFSDNDFSSNDKAFHEELLGALTEIALGDIIN